MKKPEKIMIDGVEYVRKDAIKETAQKLDGMDYVIVRTYSAGVFAGYLKSQEGKEAVVYNARRIWYWDGAASLSQLAVDGTNKPENCKFTVEVEITRLTEVIEILSVTEKARQSIQGVSTWVV